MWRSRWWWRRCSRSRSSRRASPRAVDRAGDRCLADARDRRPDVLVEQLYRGMPAVSRWGLKPLCLALAAGYIFELYLFADALLFSRIDADVWAARGIAHALLIPLIAIAGTRSPSWTLRMSVSREIVFQLDRARRRRPLFARDRRCGLFTCASSAAIGGAHCRWHCSPAWWSSARCCFRAPCARACGSSSASTSFRTATITGASGCATPGPVDRRPQSRSGSIGHQGAVGSCRELLLRVALAGRCLRQVPAAFALQPAPDRRGRGARFAAVRVPARSGWVINLEEYRVQPGRYQGLVLPDWLSRLDEAWRW